MLRWELGVTVMGRLVDSAQRGLGGWTALIHGLQTETGLKSGSDGRWRGHIHGQRCQMTDRSCAGNIKKNKKLL